ncbi:unnamed protein product [Phytophthora fragariaefolia]|uniref:Unnamed protein product n=1 Tax=Phytophthora fragariaefolia TaxID=1490495 RepID=A0A9W6YEY0_9STRA|nr:unnamed protein product [Phytophthora fragariaefolia]
MSRSEQEDDWIDEVQHREGFVLDEVSLSVPRAAGSRRAQVVFTTSPATLQDLEDGSTVLGLGPMQGKPKGFVFDGPGSIDDAEVGGATKSQVFVPTGEVPDVQEVGYRMVNPMFESCEPPAVIFRTLHKAMSEQDVEFTCSPEWTVCRQLSQLLRNLSDYL